MGDDVFGLDFFTLGVFCDATTFSLMFVDWLRFVLMLLFVVVTGTVVTVTVPLFGTELLFDTAPTIEH